MTNEMNGTNSQETTLAEDKLVPVSEAIRYRKRAQTAEQQLEATQQEMETLRQNLHASQETITALERRQRIDQLLTEADAVDLDAARLLTEVAITDMSEPDVEEAVTDLRRHKPYLFRRMHNGAGTMAARLDEPGEVVEIAADRAASSGDRRDLLHYLRLRRKH